jgi:RNA polymerase sigma factor (sigma-70 family)
MVSAEQTAQLSDGELLERFAALGEEQSFAVLVRRHGPMVLGVCRRLLHNWHDAEDGFQATFLALARKAETVGKSGSVGGWLNRVAYHVALKAKARAGHAGKQDCQVEERLVADPLAEVTGRELLTVLDEELNKLPERLRVPLVLCYLEGKTRDEVARELGWSLGSLKRRLEEGRARLHARVAGRGISLAVLLAAGVATVAVPATLAASVRDVLLGGASPARVTALANESLRALAGAKVKVSGAVLLFLVLAGAGVGLFAPHAPAGAPPASAQEVKAPEKSDKPAPVDEKQTVAGRVLDADGKPIAGAKVAVIGLVEKPYRGRTGERAHVILGSGETDKEGRFRLACAVASTNRPPIRQVLASAPGHGLDWLMLGRNIDESDVTIKLPTEQVIRGQLIDLQGQAAKGVKLHVAKVSPSPGLGSGSSSTSTSTGFGLGGSSSSGSTASEDPSGTAPPWYDFPARPAKLDVWPEVLTTDDEGRFIVRGLGKDQAVRFLVSDERFAQQHFVVSTSAKAKPEGVEQVLEPAHWLEGTVLGADTGKSIGKKVLLNVSTRDATFQAWADEKGVFRVNCPSGRIVIESFPPDGSPYLTIIQAVDWPKGKVKHEVEVTLPRGVLVRGKVTEAESGKPVASAVVSYYPRQDNPFADRAVRSWRHFPGEFVRTKDDGTFEATVPPGVGTLMAKGPTRDYVLQPLDTKELTLGKPGGAPIYAQANAPLDLKPGTDSAEVALKLQRGVTIKGRILDPDGKPVQSAVLYHSLNLQDNGDQAYFFHYSPLPVAVKDGSFALTGLDPKAKVTVFILDRKDEFGGRAVLSAGSDGEPATIKLQPCGKVKTRFLDKDGKPAKGHSLGLQFTLDADRHAEMSHAEAMGGWNVLGHSDAEGRLTVGGLIPGVGYRYFDGKKSQEITVESGKTQELPDITFRPMGGSGSSGSSQ